jgi:hypothetical protein
LVLLVYPLIVVHLLFGAEIAGTGLAVCRFAGIALIALGLACWPGRDARSSVNARIASSLRCTSAISAWCAKR